MSRLKSLGENIKKYRQAKGLTQKSLAMALDFSYEYICRVEKGQKFVSLRKLFEIADLLDVKFSDLTKID